MKIKYKLLALVLFILNGNNIYAQKQIEPLKIGDKLPDLILKTIFNHNQEITLSSLHNQDLLIINFWATWCVPCIKELPELDSLAAVNPGKLKVLSVAYEDAATVNSFFKKHPEINISHLTIATDDKILIEYFKHQVLPHNIWVDKAGIVRYITGGEEINPNFIAKFINQQSLAMHAKIDITKFDSWAPFHLSDSAFKYRSIVTPYIDGIFAGHTAQGVYNHPTERWFSRFFGYNLSKEQLFWRAINELRSNYNYYSLIKIETKDSTRFYWPKQCPQSFAHSKYKSTLDWKYDNTFCYELSLPYGVKDSVFFGFMLNDLERMFQVQITTKNETIPVCVLTLTKGYSFVKPENDSTYIDLKPNHLKAHNIQLIQLYSFLNEEIKPDKNHKPDDPPYIDKTGVKSNIDVDIEFQNKLPTYWEVKNLLKQKYGIQFEIKQQDYSIIYIKDLVP